MLLFFVAVCGVALAMFQHVFVRVVGGDSCRWSLVSLLLLLFRKAFALVTHCCCY